MFAALIPTKREHAVHWACRQIPMAAFLWASFGAHDHHKWLMVIYIITIVVLCFMNNQEYG